MTDRISITLASADDRWGPLIGGVFSMFIAYSKYKIKWYTGCNVSLYEEWEKGRERDVTISVTKCISPTKPLVCSQTLLSAYPFWDVGTESG